MASFKRRLTKEEVVSILDLTSSGVSAADIATLFGLHFTAVHRIQAGTRHRAEYLKHPYSQMVTDRHASLPNEEWRSPITVGWVEVSNFGRVRSCKNKVLTRNGLSNRILDPYADKSGYVKFVFMSKNGYSSVTVSRLVCEAFHGHPPEGKSHAAHGNGDPSDNRPENLRWATPMENCEDKVIHGTLLQGEEVPSAKLSLSEVKAIKDAIAAGEKQRCVADRFGVSQSSVSMINTGKTWKLRAEKSNAEF